MKALYSFVTILAIFPLTLMSFAQVPKKTVVEHFTNSNCSICGNKNPGFYSNLSNQTDVLHLAIHPSAPYSSCLLYQQNPTANDARTNYYGIYGATPRLVINGDVTAANTNFSDPSLFTPYVGLTSPASIRIEQEKFGNDSIRATVIIKTEATHTLGSLALFVSLAEDTVYHTGTNGETVHYDVFRKSLTSPLGDALAIPSTVGDSVLYTFSSANDPIWDFSRIFTLAILQQNVNKELVQAEATLASDNNVTTSLPSLISDRDFNIFPNPATSEIYISSKPQLKSDIQIYNSVGKLMIQTNGKNVINISGLDNGIYFIKINDVLKKFVKM